MALKKKQNNALPSTYFQFQQHCIEKYNYLTTLDSCNLHLFNIESINEEYAAYMFNMNHTSSIFPQSPLFLSPGIIIVPLVLKQ